MTEVFKWLVADPWRLVLAIYVTASTLTFLPVLRAVLSKVQLNDGGVSFDASPHFSNEGKLLLSQHYSRILGTLGFWKKQAKKFHYFHNYTLGWTVPASVGIPILA